MKKNLKIVLIIIVLVLLIVGILFSIYHFKNKGESEKYIDNNNRQELDSKVSLVKKVANSTCYFPFKEDGKEYLFLVYNIGSYNDPNKSSINISSIENEDDKLILNIDTEIINKEYNRDSNVIIDDYSINLLYATIETKQDYNSVVANVYDKTTQKTIKTDIKRFSGGIIWGITDDDKRGYIDENAEYTIPMDYERVMYLDSVNWTDKDGKRQKIDYSGYLKIQNENGYGIATTKGQILMECQYEKIINYGDRLFLVTKKINGVSQIGIVDINNNILVDFVEGDIDSNYKSVAGVEYFVYCIKSNDITNYGVMDKNLNKITEAIYEDITIEDIQIKEDKEVYKESYSEDYLIVTKDKKRAVIGINGKIKIDYSDKSVYELRNEYESMIKNQLRR